LLHSFVRLTAPDEVMVKLALAWALGLEPLWKATALTVALLVRVIAPVYNLDDRVGVEPSVV
jgi:hypothetical protein